MSKADKLFAEANKKIKLLNSWYKTFLMEKDKIKDEIEELLVKASEQYLINKDYISAIKCYEYLVDNYEDNNKYIHNLIKTYIKNDDMVQVEVLIKKYFPPDKISSETIKILTLVINENISNCDYDDAEKHLIMAESYCDYLDNYTQKLNFMSTRASVIIKQSEPRYKESSEIFVECAKQYASIQNLSFTAIPNLMNAVLVNIAQQDIIAAENIHNNSIDITPRYQNSYEGRFCADIIQTLKDTNQEEFLNIISQYDKIKTLSSDLVSILLKIKHEFFNSNIDIT